MLGNENYDAAYTTGCYHCVDGLVIRQPRRYRQYYTFNVNFSQKENGQMYIRI